MRYTVTIIFFHIYIIVIAMRKLPKLIINLV
jgi:hypothetical protein